MRFFLSDAKPVTGLHSVSGFVILLGLRTSGHSRIKKFRIKKLRF